jgi:sigma-B regulation protein RsbU (phosphoserine phosphatase)
MTDGAFELPNEDEEKFGVERIQELIRDNCHRTAREIVETLQKAITAYNPNQLPPDDITLLVLKRSET